MSCFEVHIHNTIYIVPDSIAHPLPPTYIFPLCCCVRTSHTTFSASPAINSSSANKLIAMATTISAAMRRFAPLQIRQLAPRPSAAPRSFRLTRPYSTEPAPTIPPLLTRLKTDLKTAMRAKDVPRLSVLRNVISETNNAAKTAGAVRTDVQLVMLLRKIARGNEEAAEEARRAGREDLVEKEEAQIRVIDEYVAESGVHSLNEAEMHAEVEAAMADAAKNGRPAGQVFKSLMARNWEEEGKFVDKRELARIAKEVAGNKD